VSAPASTVAGPISVEVTVRLTLGLYWAHAGTALRFRAGGSRRSGPDAAKKVAADYLGCKPDEVILAKARHGVFKATCSALPEVVQ
jgi:hypothetical protein